MLSKGGGQEWFYHAPSSFIKEEKVLVPAASQIPGLSADDQEALDRETGTNKRNMFIHDTDSKYIRLAKQGGRKDLLSFAVKKKNMEEGPMMYPRVDWFDHTPMSAEDEEKILARGKWNPPEYMVYEAFEGEPEVIVAKEKVDLGLAQKERKDIRQKYERQGVPFDTDDKSVWKREYDEVHMKNLPPDDNRIKLPPINEKKILPQDENFDKIMSGWYGNEWLKSESNQHKGKLRKMEEQHKNIHSGKFNLTEYQENICKINALRKIAAVNQPKLKRIKRVVSEEKKVKSKPFKLSKFDKIPSKLSTRASAT